MGFEPMDVLSHAAGFQDQSNNPSLATLQINACFANLTNLVRLIPVQDFYRIGVNDENRTRFLGVTNRTSSR